LSSNETPIEFESVELVNLLPTQAIDSVLMLISYGADVNAYADERSDYRSVLHFAVLSGNPEMVSLLLKQGAQPKSLIPTSKPSPLDLAVLKGDLTIIEMLIQAGNYPNVHNNMSGSNNFGYEE